ncbi:hypothetical protein K438DRAFT_1994140 [Mycena galopus ATCC 62051]|nr:hypothetical protein K438DRAFT_1994140 [Mycena galopus ATCC 62051]
MAFRQTRDDPSSVKNGIDLLKNRNENAKLGPFDGRLGAHIENQRTPFFVTTNARYIPALPILADQLLLRQDMRYGPDDPTLWPQFYSAEFCHLGAIPARCGKDAPAVLWWNPHRNDFVSPDTGKTITRGLGRLSFDRQSELTKVVQQILDDCDVYTKNIIPPARVPSLIPQLSQSLRLGLQRLPLPSMYDRMVIEVTNLQHTCLELTGGLKYMTIYKPRIDNALTESGLPDDCMGVFTMDPTIAQQFRVARLPYWFIRPLSAFQEENILRVVTPLEPANLLDLEPAPGYPPVPVSKVIEERLRSLHLCTKSAPWYQNPLAMVPAASVASPTQQAVAGPSHCSSAPQVVASSRRTPHAPAASSSRERKPPRSVPYPQSRPASKRAREPPKAERDKFLPFASPYMPSSIGAWSKGLANVDRSRPPACGTQIQNLYVFPKPAVLVSAQDESRRHMMLHHYQLVRDALFYRLGDSSSSHRPLTAQQWRDVLQGKITRQGKAGSKAEERTGVIQDVLGPAMRACGLDQFSDFPVDPTRAPSTSHDRAKELVWEVSEINFRYELLEVDARASGLSRPDDCRQCFPGHLLLGFDLSAGKMGFAADASEDRLPYLLRLARLMLDWKPRPRPPQISSTFSESQSNWDAARIDGLEDAVAGYYCNTFYDFFGRAAVVPMCLTHEILHNFYT